MTGVKQTGATTPEILKWIEGDIVALTVDTAERVMREEAAKSNGGMTLSVITDGVFRRDYRQVKPYGRIELFTRPNRTTAVMWALEQLRALSPRGPDEDGHYVDDHWILVNGAGVTGADPRKVLDSAPPEARVQIVNIRPYARKIEGKRANRKKQWKRRRGLSRMAPNGVYRQVYQQVLQRFGRTVLVDYKLQQLSLDGVKTRAGFFKRTSASGYYTYPVLNFFVRPDA